MSLFAAGCAPAVIVGGAMAGSAAAMDRRTVGTLFDDQSIELKITYQIMKHKDLWYASHISVTSYNNSVLLVGQTSNEHYKQQLSEIARRICNVRHVYNEVTICTPISLARRTEDSWITARVAAKLIAADQLGPNRVKTVTENGIVYLMGIVTPAERKVAIDIARRVNGVRQVVDVFESEPG